MKEIRGVRKEMLSNINDPRWEISHHYYLTCIEHSWGHIQPHILDVGEMIPGHLKTYAIANWSTLYQKSMLHEIQRAKNQKINKYKYKKSIIN